MSICGLHGRASLGARTWGFCDRCNFLYDYDELSWQFQYSGQGLLNLRILVCGKCLDQPAAFLQSIILPPDPVPILNPRPGFQAQEEAVGQFVDDTPVPAPPPSYYRTWVSDESAPMRDSLGNIFYFVSDVAA